MRRGRGGQCFTFPVINGEFFQKLLGSTEVGILSPAVEKWDKVFPTVAAEMASGNMGELCNDCH